MGTQTHFSSKLDIIRACKSRPGVLLSLDAGDGWRSLWISDKKGKEPRRYCMVNPAGENVFGM